MSSNMYGYQCTVTINGFEYDVQVVYNGTDDSNTWSIERVINDWETDDPILLAKWELNHRDWTKPTWHPVNQNSRISVWATYPIWKNDVEPPNVSEQQIFEAIANGNVEDIEEGWDT